MARLLLVINLFFFLFLGSSLWAQHFDSSINNLQKIPRKYIKEIDKKIDQYSNRLSSKTEKTLAKLSRWENKIQGLLQKVNPDAADRLFGNNQVTFTSLLQKLKEGEAIALQCQAPYNKYRDDVTTTLAYLAQQKEQLDSGLIKKINETNGKMEALATEEDNSEYVQQFIKERKKQLMAQAIQYIGKSKYLTNINKEAYYYTETLRNYQELFSDSQRAEETVKTILNKIPAFQQFVKSNSFLASLFSQQNSIQSPAAIAGLQTRASIQSLLQERITSGGPNAMQQVQENIQEAKNQINQLKEKLLSNATGGSDGGELPDFKPNMQKTKTFSQRLEYGYNLQFVGTNHFVPATSDIALTIGYKLNDKSVIGGGATYKMGMGSIQHIEITHQGVGFRTFIDWKLKKQIFMSGGYEWNYNAQFKNIEQLKNYDAWQRSALGGIKKKISLKSKWFKETTVQLLYDFLYQQHVPISQPVLFRIGYNF